MAPDKMAEVEQQLKVYERKLDNYEREYKKSFQEQSVNEKYQEYMLETIRWLRLKIDTLFGMKAGNLHRAFMNDGLPHPVGRAEEEVKAEQQQIVYEEENMGEDAEEDEGEEEVQPAPVANDGHPQSLPQ